MSELDYERAVEQDAEIARELGRKVLRVTRGEHSGYIYADDYQPIHDFSSNLKQAWRLQREHPIEGAICLNLSWLELTPQEAAFKMAETWLRLRRSARQS